VAGHGFCRKKLLRKSGELDTGPITRYLAMFWRTSADLHIASGHRPTPESVHIFRYNARSV